MDNGRVMQTQNWSQNGPDVLPQLCNYRLKELSTLGMLGKYFMVSVANWLYGADLPPPTARVKWEPTNARGVHFTCFSKRVNIRNIDCCQFDLLSTFSEQYSLNTDTQKI